MFNNACGSVFLIRDMLYFRLSQCLMQNYNRSKNRGWLTDLEMAWMTLEKPTASFSSSCRWQTSVAVTCSEKSSADVSTTRSLLCFIHSLTRQKCDWYICLKHKLTCSFSSFCCSLLFRSSSSTLLIWIYLSFCTQTKDSKIRKTKPKQEVQWDELN